jgi:hypothetical protein
MWKGENGLWLCPKCHERQHDSPEKAAEFKLLREVNAARTVKDVERAVDDYQRSIDWVKK